MDAKDFKFSERWLLEVAKEDEPLGVGGGEPVEAVSTTPRFAETFCSQCGTALGPGNSGVSHCADHETKKERDKLIDFVTAVLQDEDKFGSLTCGTTKAPNGWHCTRELGHSGPCAAKVSTPLPQQEEPATMETLANELFAALQAMVNYAHAEHKGLRVADEALDKYALFMQSKRKAAPIAPLLEQESPPNQWRRLDSEKVVLKTQLAQALASLAAAQKEIAVLSTRLREEKEDNALLIKCETEAESKLSEAQQTIERLKKNIKNK